MADQLAEFVGGSQDGSIAPIDQPHAVITVTDTKLVPAETRPGYVGGDHQFTAQLEVKVVDSVTGKRINEHIDPDDPRRSTCVCGRPYEDHAVLEKPEGETRTIGERLLAGESIPAGEFAGWDAPREPVTTEETYQLIGERQGRYVYALRMPALEQK